MAGTLLVDGPRIKVNAWGSRGASVGVLLGMARLPVPHLLARLWFDPTFDASHCECRQVVPLVGAKGTKVGPMVQTEHGMSHRWMVKDDQEIQNANRKPV
ncbi:hypothetical protein [Novipirellula rosea]|uniref:hypothetical protein n=1 Tax=Novipirellula rosea TaxID=1031540 RepID=UPI0031F0206B